MLKRILFKLLKPIIIFFKEYSANLPLIYGANERLKVGEGVSLVNTLFNVASGDIVVGDNTIFGHNCMVLTGVHEFQNGKRKKLLGKRDTPIEGKDIVIGSGCWIASGSIIVGGVKIGDNVIVAAGSVITKDIPSGVMVGGVPAKIIKKIEEEN